MVPMASMATVAPMTSIPKSSLKAVININLEFREGLSKSAEVVAVENLEFGDRLRSHVRGPSLRLARTEENKAPSRDGGIQWRRKQRRSVRMKTFFIDTRRS